MNKKNSVMVITDSNAGIHLKDAGDNLLIVPMPFMIDEGEFFEDINLNTSEFYQALNDDKKISTSQPSPGDIISLWDEALKTYDSVVYIPMSSGLSKSYDTALMLSQEYKGRVQVVDAKKISVTQKQAVFDAIVLAEHGKTASEIKEIIEANSLNSSIYIMVDTLKYLKRGGRITPVVAAFGALLKIKPILQIQGDKLDSFAKVMNVTQAKQRMISAIRRDIETRFMDDYKAGCLQISIAHTNNSEKAAEFEKEVRSVFPDIEIGYNDELSLSVSCHIGPGALAIALTKKLA